jgi:hypothetical protein
MSLKRVYPGRNRRRAGPVREAIIDELEPVHFVIRLLLNMLYMPIRDGKG